MMTSIVHILATCRKAELLPATTLVFRTLRVGFPTAEIVVWGNRLSLDAERAVASRVTMVGGQFVPLDETLTHDVWIEKLMDRSEAPFWVCDTDMVFFGSVESFADGLMAGRYEPAFLEPWSKTHKVSRLHTSLLWLNAPKLRPAMKEWLLRWHPKHFPFTPETELIRQTYVPQGAGKPPLFYDTCAGLYHALGGTAFTEEQNAAFEHLHCGTYSDRINCALTGITQVHQAVFNDVQAARGLRQEQDNFYRTYALQP